MLLLTIAMLAQPAAGFDFQGVALRSSIEALKSRPPETGKYSAKRIACSDQPDAPSFLQPSREDKGAGVVKCSLVEVIGGSTGAADTDLGPDHSAAVRYQFLDGRLFKIEVFPDIGAKEVVQQSLVARFGPPSERINVVAQNGAGATFDQQRWIWVSAEQTIRMTAPDMRPTKMTVIYQDEAAAKKLEERRNGSRLPVM